MNNNKAKRGLFTHIFRGLVEVGFIIFLFYSNLLMGDYSRNGNARGKNIVWALHDVCTTANFEIAIIAAVVGYIVFEFLRKLS